MNINKILLFYILLLNYLFVNCQISYIDITPPENLNIYPNSPGEDCVISLFYLIDTSTSSVINFQNDQIYLKGYKYYNSTSNIYQIDFPVEYAGSKSKNFNLTVDTSSSLYTKSVQISCLGISPSLLNFEVVTPLKLVNSKFQSIFKVGGLKSVLKEFNAKFNNKDLKIKLMYDNYYLIQIDAAPEVNYTSNWTIDFVFQNSVALEYKSPLESKFYTWDIGGFNSNALSVYSSPVAELSINTFDSGFILMFYSDYINTLSKQPIRISGTSSMSKYLLCSENFFNFDNNSIVLNNPLTYVLYIPNNSSYHISTGGLSKNYFVFNGVKTKELTSQGYFSGVFYGFLSFDYKDTIDSPVVSIISVGSLFNITRILEFPYGIKSASGPQNAFTFTESVILLNGVNSFYYSVNNLNTFQSSPFSITGEKVAPVLVKVDIQPLDNGLVLFTIEAKDDDSGISYFILGDHSSVNNGKDYSFYSVESLTSGNLNYGVFLMVYDTIKCPISSTNFGITVIDAYSNFNTYKVNSEILSSIAFSKLSFNYQNFDPLIDIKSVFFLHNNVDVSSNGYNNTIYIYAPILSGTGISIYYEIKFTEYRIEKGFAKYNLNSKLFEGSFYLLKNLPSGQVPYSLSFPNSNNSVVVDSAYLKDEFQLNVTSAKFDTFGPYFTKFEAVFENNKYGFNFTINDDYNGFKSGYIVVRGLIDRSIYNFTIPMDSTFKYSFNYSIRLPEFSDPCASQRYYVTDVYLEDEEGYINQFHKGQRDSPKFQQLNPFFKFSNSIVTYFDVTCSTTWDPLIDITTLTSFTITPNLVDVFSNSRSVLVEVIITDQSRMKTNQIVYVHLTSNFDVIKFPLSLEAINANGEHSFKGNLEIPYGFGAFSSQIFLSINGFISNKGIITSFSSFDFDSKILIDKTISVARPSIVHVEANQLDQSGLIIFVTYALSIQKISVQIKETILTFNSSDINVLSPNQVSIKISQPFEAALISLHYLIGGITYYSNNYEYSHNVIQNYSCASNCGGVENGFCIGDNKCYCINGNTNSNCLGAPTLTPTNPTSTPIATNPPQLCKGTPLCGGSSQGVCKSSGCVCLSPYFGLDCSSKSINIGSPSVNENSPEIKIILDTNNSSDSSGTTSGSNLNKPVYSSSIGIVYLREIDINSKVVNSYILGNWLKKELSNDDKSTKYQYDITITNENDSSKTNIQTLLEFYKKDSKVNFADQEIQIYKSSIKYTVNISKYSFKSQFNTLELLMSASIESSNTNSVCSRKEFGDSTSDYSNYIKLQVEDHSFYGRFIKRGIKDENTIIDISNKIINRDEENDENLIKIYNNNNSPFKSQSLISISIPNFENSVTIDPDFSVLLDSRSASKSSDSLCSNNNNKSLTSTQLAGIIIACVGFALIAVVVGSFIFYKKSSKARIYVHKLKTFKK